MKYFLVSIFVSLVLICFNNMFINSFKLLSSHHNSLQLNRRMKSELFAKKKHKVTVQHEGKEYVLEVAENYSILDASLDAGIDLPHDCKLGVCLTCPSRIVSGQIDTTGSTLDDSVAEKGFALTCCSFPRSDVVVRSIDEDELVSAQFKRDS